MTEINKLAEMIKNQVEEAAQRAGDEGTEGGTDRPWSSLFSIACGSAA